MTCSEKVDPEALVPASKGVIPNEHFSVSCVPVPEIKPGERERMQVKRNGQFSGNRSSSSDTLTNLVFCFKSYYNYLYRNSKRKNRHHFAGRISKTEQRAKQTLLSGAFMPRL